MLGRAGGRGGRAGGRPGGAGGWAGRGGGRGGRAGGRPPIFSCTTPFVVPVVLFFLYPFQERLFRTLPYAMSPNYCLIVVQISLEMEGKQTHMERKGDENGTHLER